MTDWSKLRAAFPALANWTYLDTATFGQLPRSASEAILHHLAHRDETASTQFLSWFDDMDQIRASCAELINASATDIAFVPSASTGLAWLMQGLDWKAGDEVLTLADEFPNQLYQGPSCQRAGAIFRAAAWHEFYQSINDRTRLVLLSTVNYANGCRPPLNEIGSLLRERGILLYVDGTQSVGALQFNVQDVQPSMLCVDAYKWLLSPNGAGFVYIDPALRERMTPTVIGWRSDAGWRSVNNLNHGTPIFTNSAQRYEGGMLPFASLYAMGAVIQMLLQIGPSAIEERVLELAAKIRTTLLSLGGEVNTDISQIVTARLPGRDASGLASQLRSKRILISARHGRLRISPHFYNNEADIETLGAALSAAEC